MSAGTVSVMIMYDLKCYLKKQNANTSINDLYFNASVSWFITQGFICYLQQAEIPWKQPAILTLRHSMYICTFFGDF